MKLNKIRQRYELALKKANNTYFDNRRINICNARMAMLYYAFTLEIEKNQLKLF